MIIDADDWLITPDDDDVEENVGLGPGQRN